MDSETLAGAITGSRATTRSCQITRLSALYCGSKQQDKGRGGEPEGGEGKDEGMEGGEGGREGGEGATVREGLGGGTGE